MFLGRHFKIAQPNLFIFVFLQSYKAYVHEFTWIWLCSRQKSKSILGLGVLRQSTMHYAIFLCINIGFIKVSTILCSKCKNCNGQWMIGTLVRKIAHAIFTLFFYPNLAMTLKNFIVLILSIYISIHFQIQWWLTL